LTSAKAYGQEGLHNLANDAADEEATDEREDQRRAVDVPYTPS
jgi:hypothetical protein